MNTKEDRVVRLFKDSTSIIDSTGNEEKAKIVRIGASTSISTFLGAFAETTLPTNVPVKVTVTFGGVETNVNHLTFLTLGIQFRASNDVPTEQAQIQFRGIPLH